MIIIYNLLKYNSFICKRNFYLYIQNMINIIKITAEHSFLYVNMDWTLVQS